MSLSEWRKVLAEALTKAGFAAEAPQEAKWLLGAAISRDGSFVSLNPNYTPSSSEEEKIRAWLQRRLKGEPLSRLKGMREFWGLPFHLNEHTLDPRPESELIIEAVLKWVGAHKKDSWRILDCGTGTGCLLISLLHEFQNASGLGIDIASGALSMAQYNAELNSVSKRAQFQNSSWGKGLKKKFDIIVSNPPYIPLRDKETLERGVREYDPPQALFGGEDGLESYVSLAKAIPPLLAPKGLVVLEIGVGQTHSVSSLFQKAGFHRLFVLKDLQGIERALAFEL